MYICIRQLSGLSRCSFSVTSVRKGEITNVIDSDSMQEVRTVGDKIKFPLPTQKVVLKSLQSR